MAEMNAKTLAIAGCLWLVWTASVLNAQPTCVTKIAKLRASDISEGDYFGAAVAIEGRDLFASAPRRLGAQSTGQVYRFAFDGTDWQEQEILRSQNPSSAFGSALDLDGDTIAIGAETTLGFDGSAFVFTRSPTGWVEQQELTPQNPPHQGFFGQAVALDGDLLAVGMLAYGKPFPDHAGSVFVFQRSGTVWSQIQEIQSSRSTVGDQFGRSVALQGDVLVVGSVQDLVFSFVFNGIQFVEQQFFTSSNLVFEDGFGREVAMDGSFLVVGAPFNDFGASLLNAGSAYVFRRTGSQWVERAVLTARQKRAFEKFGQGVAIHGDYVLAGAPDFLQGVAYKFQHEGTVWTHENKLRPRVVNDVGDDFGIALDTDGVHIAVGRPAEGNPLNSGSIFVFTYSDAETTEVGTGLAGAGGQIPQLTLQGCPCLHQAGSVEVENGLGAAPGFLLIGAATTSLPLFGGQLHVAPPFLISPHSLAGVPGQPGAGTTVFPFEITQPSLVDSPFALQAVYLDGAGPAGFSLSNGLVGTIGF
jgi:hypothetical protein